MPQNVGVRFVVDEEKLPILRDYLTQLNRDIGQMEKTFQEVINGLTILKQKIDSIKKYRNFIKSELSIKFVPIEDNP